MSKITSIVATKRCNNSLRFLKPNNFNGHIYHHHPATLWLVTCIKNEQFTRVLYIHTNTSKLTILSSDAAKIDQMPLAQKATYNSTTREAGKQMPSFMNAAFKPVGARDAKYHRG